MLRFTSWDTPRYIPYIPQFTSKQQFTRTDLPLGKYEPSTATTRSFLSPPSPYIPANVESLLHFYPVEDLDETLDMNERKVKVDEDYDNLNTSLSSYSKEFI